MWNLLDNFCRVANDNFLSQIFLALLIALHHAEGRPEAAQSGGLNYGLSDNSILQFGRLANDGFPKPPPEGHVCMDKVVEVEETIYDEEMRRVTWEFSQ